MKRVSYYENKLYPLFLKTTPHIENNTITSVILEIKTMDVKSFRHKYFVLFPENIFRVKINHFTSKIFSGKKTNY